MNTQSPFHLAAQADNPVAPYVRPILNDADLIVGWEAFTDKGTFHVRYDLDAPKSYQPPQALFHVAPFSARAEARGSAEDKAFRALFRGIPYTTRRDVADVLHPIIKEASKNARSLDPDHQILTDFSFMARTTVYQFLRTTKPGTPERKALMDALAAVPSLPTLVPLPALPKVRAAIIRGTSLKELVKRHTNLSWKVARKIDPWASGLFILHRGELLHRDGLLTRNDVGQHLLDAQLNAQREIIGAVVLVSRAARQDASTIPADAIPWAARIAKEAHQRDHDHRAIMDWAISAMKEPDGLAGAWSKAIDLDGAIRRVSEWQTALSEGKVPDLSWSRPAYAPPDDALGKASLTFIDNAQALADAADVLGNCARTYIWDAHRGHCAVYTITRAGKTVGMLEIIGNHDHDEHRWTCIQAVAKFNQPLSRQVNEHLRDYAERFGGEMQHGHQIA